MHFATYLLAISNYFLGLIYLDEMLIHGSGANNVINISDLQIPALNYKLGKLCTFLSLIHLSCCFQEDLTPKDIEEIIDELKAGRVPPPGPRYFNQELVVSGYTKYCIRIYRYSTHKHIIFSTGMAAFHVNLQVG